jgi:predicted nucleic acid-binding protein
MIVLDTNVVSETLKPNPSPNVVDWFVAQAAASLVTTTVTQAEMLYGLELIPSGKRRDAMKAAIAKVLSRFEGNMLPFDEPAAVLYAVIAAQRDRLGLPISEKDAMIAAIARSRGASIATRDTNGFRDCGVPLIDPWKDSLR